MECTTSVGISDIAIYLPKLCIDHSTLIEKRVKSCSHDLAATLEKKLKRTVERTGLKSMHFPAFWEDSVTMAAEAASRLIRRGKINLKALRYLVTGTETGVDHSKPIAAYVCGMLQKSGFQVPQSISTFQTQHACAGGTLALMGISALLAVCGANGESGIVMCSDIARYEPETTAEMTQGAGAVAMLTEVNPKLIALDLKNAGYSSKDVDDFFRPLGSTIAKVKGGYSIRCYREAMESALCDHARRSGKDVATILTETDMFALHVPYPSLPTETMRYLVRKYLQLDDIGVDAFLEGKGFFAMTEPASKSGNLYSGSMFLSLAFLLEDRVKKFGQDIVGKKVLLGSYGSGNTMVFLPGEVAKEAPEVIKQWDLNGLWQENATPFDTYNLWVNNKESSADTYVDKLSTSLSDIEFESFYLNRVREDGYREYLSKG